MDGLRPEILRLVVADPRHQCVDIGVGRHVRRHHPQRGTEARTVAVERLVERQAVIVERGGGGDDSGAAAEQFGDHRCGDGSLGRAGDDRNLIGVQPGAGVLRTGRYPGIQGGVNTSALRQRASAPPIRLSGHHMPGALETLRQRRPIRVDVVLVRQPQLDQILPGAGPPIIQQDSFFGVECRCDQSWPLGTEFTGDQVDQFSVSRQRKGADRVIEPELAQHQSGSRGQHAGGTGHGRGELIQSGRVDHSAATGAAGRRQCHRNTVPGSDCGHRLIDSSVHSGGVRKGAVVQPTEGSTPNACALPGAQNEFNRDVLGPALAEFPCLGDSLGNCARSLARRPEDAAQ